MERPEGNTTLKVFEDTEIMDQLQDPRLMQMLLKGANNVLDVMLDYKQLMFAASAAMKIVKTKLEILDTEFKMTHNRDPIHSIQTRLKSQASILEKMAKRGIEPTTENMERYVSDLAGARVICGYVDDIYTIEHLLAEQEDLEILERKDYIVSPKKSGYRSLQLILQVPVFLPGGIRKTKVEVQLRTIGMDFWAALEHEIGPAGVYFVAIAILMFAYTSIIGNYYYGEANLRYLLGKKQGRGYVTAFRILSGGCFVLFGGYASLEMVWSIGDLFMALLTGVNLFAIVRLSPLVWRLLDHYRAQRKAGKDPVFHRSDLPGVALDAWEDEE